MDMDEFLYHINKSMKQLLDTIREDPRIKEFPPEHALHFLIRSQMRLFITIIQRKTPEEVKQCYDDCIGIVTELSEIADEEGLFQHTINDAMYLHVMNIAKDYRTEIDTVYAAYKEIVT